MAERASAASLALMVLLGVVLVSYLGWLISGGRARLTRWLTFVRRQGSTGFVLRLGLLAILSFVGTSVMPFGFGFYGYLAFYSLS